VADSRVDLARSYVGVAVRAGAPRPDIASEMGLRATLLSARSVVYSQIGASGIFFAELIERLGIASEVNARARIIPSGLTAQLLTTGEADLAVQQVSELMLIPGTEIVGPIPKALQSPMVFAAGRLAASGSVTRSDRLLRFLASTEMASALRDSGLEP
jgi:molybdate transport system substrate-binding protein